MSLQQSWLPQATLFWPFWSRMLCPECVSGHGGCFLPDLVSTGGPGAGQGSGEPRVEDRAGAAGLSAGNPRFAADTCSTSSGKCQCLQERPLISCLGKQTRLLACWGQDSRLDWGSYLSPQRISLSSSYFQPPQLPWVVPGYLLFYRL